MKSSARSHVSKTLLGVAAICLLLGIYSKASHTTARALDPQEAPAPLVKKGHPVKWWFVFKLNSAAFPGCGGGAMRQCLFGGQVQNYRAFGQQFVYASSEDKALQQGSDCAGDTTDEPIGATFDEVYNGSYHYVVWN